MPLRCYLCPRLPPIYTDVIRDSIHQFTGKITEVTSLDDAKVIICQPVDCIRYGSPVGGCDSVFSVSPLWIFNSVLKQRIEPFYLYYPDPHLIFSGLSFDTRHLDDCTMTDFYSQVIEFLGGRVIADPAEHATHIVMETKPFEANEVHLASPKCAVSQIDVFVEKSLLSCEKSRDLITSGNHEMALDIRSSVSSHTVSYSWLDACITQRTKLREDNFYTHSKENGSKMHLKKSRPKRNELTDIEFLHRTNTSRPLEGIHLLISRRLNPTHVQGIGDAAEWLGATVVNPTDIVACDDKSISIVTAPYTVRLGSGLSRPSVSPYYVAKLLRAQGAIPGPFGIAFPLGMPSALQSFLSSIYCPRPMKVLSDSAGEPKLALCGSIFAISGFGDSGNESGVPTKHDIAASVSVLGGYTACCMVEGITSYLVSETMSGGKYEIAKRWGDSKIRVVHWKWLMHCMVTGSALEPFEEDLSDDAYQETASGEPTLSDKCFGTEEELSPRGVAVDQASQSQPAEFNFYASELSQAADTADVPEASNSIETVIASVEECRPSEGTPSNASQVHALEIDYEATSIEQNDGSDVNRSAKTSRVCPTFLFGGGTEEQFRLSRAMVESLGGTVVWPIENCYDQRCTHLLLWKMTRTEKYLCACAAGKWILRPEYLSACCTSMQGNPISSSGGHFLPEEDYEWGEEKFAILLTGGQCDWARAGRRSRLRITRPFSDVQALIFGTTAPPAVTLQRMVLSGGGSAWIVPDLNALLLLYVRLTDEVARKSSYCVRDYNSGASGTGTMEGGAQYDAEVGTLTARTDPNSLNGITTIITSIRSDGHDSQLQELCATLAGWGITVPLQNPSHLLDSLCEEPPACSISDVPTGKVDKRTQHRVRANLDLTSPAHVAKPPNKSKRRKLSQLDSASPP